MPSGERGSGRIARAGLVRRTAAVVAAFVLASALVGCGSTVSGSAAPVPPPAEPAAAPPGDGVDPALEVADPLDASRLLNDPCAALSDAHREQLDVGAGEARG